MGMSFLMLQSSGQLSGTTGNSQAKFRRSPNPHSCGHVVGPPRLSVHDPPPFFATLMYFPAPPVGGGLGDCNLQTRKEPSLTTQLLGASSVAGYNAQHVYAATVKLV